MKKSIKWKLTITYIVFLVCLIGSILLFNTLFLEKLYINEKRVIIKNAYYALENGITEAYDAGYTLSDLFKKRKSSNGTVYDSSLTRFLVDLQEVYGVMTFLVDSNNKTYSLFQSSARFDKRIMEYIYKDAKNNENLEILEKNDLYTIAINNGFIAQFAAKKNGTDDEGPSEFYENSGPGKNSNDSSGQQQKTNRIRRMQHADIECFGFLSDNTTAFFLTIPVESIKEPIDLFNRVLILVSLVALIIGSIIIYFISNNFSQPLLELSKISKKMSNLEFENKYIGNFDDEIGVLGNAMNEMSEKLENSIKELKNANIKLQKDLEKKEQLDLMRQEFVANVSHELKTPISLIKGYSEGLETDGIADSKENRDYYISVIKDEADKMGIMVRQLLDLSSLERGMEELDIVRINLHEVVEGVLNNYEIKIKEENINIILDIDDNIFVWADGYKLEEVIRNYLTNAINHVDENKLIMLSKEKIKNNTIRFYIYNSGIQLTEDEINKIWEKFYKVDKSHSRMYGGTGLGLSIVKAIADKHNTICRCENYIYNNIKGIRFYFDLPTE